MKCIICNEKLNSTEYNELADEFKPYPVHGDCFDEFEDAEVFLDYARSLKKDTSKLNTPSIKEQESYI